jgi:hypothetical protein
VPNNSRVQFRHGLNILGYDVYLGRVWILAAFSASREISPWSHDSPGQVQIQVVHLVWLLSKQFQTIYALRLAANKVNFRVGDGNFGRLVSDVVILW